VQCGEPQSLLGAVPTMVCPPPPPPPPPQVYMCLAGCVVQAGNAQTGIWPAEAVWGSAKAARWPSASPGVLTYLPYLVAT
jgi:hypothetical protein